MATQVGDGEVKILDMYDKYIYALAGNRIIPHHLDDFLKLCGFEKDIYEKASCLDPILYHIWDQYRLVGKCIPFEILIRECMAENRLPIFTEYLNKPINNGKMDLDTWLSDLPKKMPKTIADNLGIIGWGDSNAVPSYWTRGVYNGDVTEEIKKRVAIISFGEDAYLNKEINLTKSGSIPVVESGDNSVSDIMDNKTMINSDNTNSKSAKLKYIEYNELRVDDIIATNVILNNIVGQWTQTQKLFELTETANENILNVDAKIKGILNSETITEATKMLAILTYNFNTNDTSFLKNLAEKFKAGEPLSVYESFFLGTIDMYISEDHKKDFGGAFWSFVIEKKKDISSTYMEFVKAFFCVMHYHIHMTSSHSKGKIYCIGFFEIILLMNKFSKGNMIISDKYESQKHSHPPRKSINGLTTSHKDNIKYYKRNDGAISDEFPDNDVNIEINKTTYILISGLPRSIVASRFCKLRVANALSHKIPKNIVHVPTDDMLAAASISGIINGELNNIKPEELDKIMTYSGDDDRKFEQSLIIKNEILFSNGWLLQAGSIDQFPNLARYSHRNVPVISETL